MTDGLKDFLLSRKKRKFATDAGNSRHIQMRRIVIDGDVENGDPSLIAKIKLHPELLPYFSQNAKTEVPIAGQKAGKTISRRIDRMLVDHDGKRVIFIDYKTDLDKNALREKYLKQMGEYSELLKSIYPDYSVQGFILWLQDFSFEKIVDCANGFPRT
jgi:hypothetical protein